MEAGEEGGTGPAGAVTDRGAGRGPAGPAADEGLEGRAASVRERVARAAERAGRDPAGVEILPVTKGHPARVVRAAREAGFAAVGENRVGEAEEKRRSLGGRAGLRWHMIGHLQRNKARRAVALFDVVESVDSLRLARTLDAEAERAGLDALEVLAQVNTSGEEAKGGFDAAPDEAGAVAAIRELCGLPRLAVAGLMTMAPLTNDAEVLRRTFRRARRLFERCAAEVEGFGGRALSMGMSNDFEIAVEEGATRLRLGTVLLGERPDG